MDTRQFSSLPDNLKSAEIWKALDRIATSLDGGAIPGQGNPAFATGLFITVAELKSLTSTPPDNIDVGDIRFVIDPTHGAGIYQFSEAAAATDPPNYYRSDDDTGVWSKQ